MIERRNITQEFRVSSDAEPTITGYAAVFDSPTVIAGLWTEIIDPHAFDSIIGSNPDVRCIFNHNPDYVIGRTTAGTMSIALDTRGLSYTATPPQTQWATDLLTSMRRKDITGSSVGFVCARDQWTEEADGSVTRRILEVETLFDASPVTFPAYDAATSQVRSLPDSIPAEFRSRIESRSIPTAIQSPVVDTWAEDAELRLRLAEAA